MRSETLGRRNAALVQSTELDHSSCAVKDRWIAARDGRRNPAPASTTGAPALIGGRHDAKGAGRTGAREGLGRRARPSGRSAAVIERALAEIGAAIQRDGRVTLPGFGTFTVRFQNARVGRNPQTGEAIDLPAGATVASSRAASCAPASIPTADPRLVLVLVLVRRLRPSSFVSRPRPRARPSRSRSRSRSILDLRSSIRGVRARARARARGRKTTDERRRTKDDGRKTTDERRRTKDDGRRRRTKTMRVSAAVGPRLPRPRPPPLLPPLPRPRPPAPAARRRRARAPRARRP